MNRRNTGVVSKRVVIYARLSVSREESVSISRQTEAARKYADARGWQVVGVFTDDGVSASKVKPEDRPGWRALVASPERFDAVIVWKVDRLARRVVDFLKADEELQALDAGIVAVEDPIDMTTPSGRAFATLLAVFGEMEAAAISARVRDAHRALMKAGRRSGGRPPYGWMNVPNPNGPGLVLGQDPERIGYVSELAARAARGESLYACAKWMDASGAPRRPNANRKTESWSVASVESILRNPVLAGMTSYEPGRKAGSDPDPTAVLRDEDGMPIVDESVAILTTAERRKLLEILDAAKRPGTRAYAGSGLLSRAVRCANCDRFLHRALAGGTPAYRCQDKVCASRPTINRANLETYVVDRLLTERGDYWLHTFADASENAVELGDIEGALRDAAARLTEDNADVERLTRQIAALKELRTKARHTAPRRRTIITGKTVAQAWREATTDLERRAILVGQIDTLAVGPGRRGRSDVAPRVTLTWQEIPESPTPEELAHDGDDVEVSIVAVG